MESRGVGEKEKKRNWSWEIPPGVLGDVLSSIVRSTCVRGSNVQKVPPQDRSGDESAGLVSGR